MKSLTLEGVERKDTGSKFAKEIRRNNMVPCNLYGGEDNIIFQAAYNDFQKLVYTNEFFTITVKVNGKEYNTIIKNIQFDPVTDQILHVDFLELIPNKTIITEIPIRLIGNAIGVKNGGILRHKVRKLRVKSLPRNLVEHIDVDIEDLTFGKSIKVEELEVGELEVLTPLNIPVVTVAAPRKAEEVAEEVEGEEGEEGEGSEEGKTEEASTEKPAETEG